MSERGEWWGIVKKITPESSTEEVFDALKAYVEGYHAEHQRPEKAWRKLSIIIQWKQHREMANLTKNLTIATWVLAGVTIAVAMGTWWLVFVSMD